MPFRAPGAGILGPHPGTPPHHVYYTGHPDSSAFTASTPLPDVWNQQALLATLNTTAAPPTGLQTAEWFLDTDASSHMSSSPGNFTSPQSISNSSPITVGNGVTMPVTHRASTVITASRSLLQLNNILISPSLVKNLISIRSLTRDNNVSVEFDPFGFSIKDLPTHTVLLRCNSHGKLYPLTSSSPEALVTTVPTVELWHQRLGIQDVAPFNTPSVI
jgi:hypothetical protein